MTFGMNVEAQTIEEVEIGKDTVSEEDVMQYGVNLFDWDSIEALQNELSSAMPEDVSFDLKTAMEKMIKGEAKFSVNTIIEYILKLLFNEITFFFTNIFNLFLLLILGTDHEEVQHGEHKHQHDNGARHLVHSNSLQIV